MRCSDDVPFSKEGCHFQVEPAVGCFWWVYPTSVNGSTKLLEGAEKTGTDNIAGGTQHYQLCG